MQYSRVINQLAHNGDPTESLNSFMKKCQETCVKMIEENSLYDSCIVAKKYRKPLIQALVTKEMFKFMAKNNYELKFPYAGSSIEKLQRELLMGINESNDKNEMLLNAIELVELSRE